MPLERQLHGVADFKPCLVPRFGGEFSHVFLEIIPTVFVIAEFIPLARNLMEEYGEIPKMILAEQVTHARLIVGMETAVFVNVVRIKADYHADAPGRPVIG